MALREKNRDIKYVREATKGYFKFFTRDKRRDTRGNTAKCTRRIQRKYYQILEIMRQVRRWIIGGNL